MKQLFRMLKETLYAGEDAVLVTVTATSGSTPRGAGARMLVTKEGRVYGTIGGGSVEYQSEQRAMDVLKKKRSHTECFMLHENQIQDLGMICGGEVLVYFQYAASADKQMREIAGKIENLYQTGEVSWLIQDLTEGSGCGMAVYGKKSGISGMEVPGTVLEALGTRPMRLEADGHLYYHERLVQSGKVYIFGGGHVAQALVPTLAAVDFQCIVLEDREEFCSPELFPGAVETRMIDSSKAETYAGIQEEDYVCIMTRGHKNDLEVQAHVLRTPAGYIGVIGSRRKKAGVFEKLREQGFDGRDLGRIKTPIGLEIKAETPAEIAVSIAGELILHRAERMQRGIGG